LGREGPGTALTPLQLALSAGAPAKTPRAGGRGGEGVGANGPGRQPAQLAAKRIVKRNTMNPMTGKDLTKVIAVLKRAGAT